VDYSVLPDILALGLLIGAYRPLVRRAGAHVNLWFVGWGLVLVHALMQLVQGTGGLPSTVCHAVGLAALALSGLSFLLASDKAEQRLGMGFALELGLPMMAQIVLSVFAVEPMHASPGAMRFAVARGLVNALFSVVAVHALLARRAWTSPQMVIGLAFWVFGFGTMPLAIEAPALVTQGLLAMVFLSAAYVCLLHAPRYSKGVVTTVAGMACWGLKYPFVLAMEHFYPGVHLDRGFLEMPQYMVVAGSILTLLEDHLIRTERMAMHDALTDLPNRRLFEERFAAALVEAREEQTTVACLVIDVDNFKTINDTLGHAVGDELLRALAVRLAWHMSPRDMLARTGGDEFTAMLAGVTDEHHLRFVASAMMSAASVPIAAQGLSIDVRISMGIALSPDDADDIQGLRNAADDAMYQAKRRGGNLLCFAGEAKEEPVKVVREGAYTAPILQMKPLVLRERASGGQRG
jgi:diguanylate cyclase (GGDEF)-like protein